MRLAELQTALGAALEGTPDPDLHSLIASRRMSAEDCLQLYSELQHSARIAHLKRYYPVTARLVGDTLCALLAQRLADRMHDIVHRGQSDDALGPLLAECSAAHPELARHAFLPELARLEWLYYEAWAAADDPSLNFSALSELPEPQQGLLRLVPSHSLRLMHVHWPVHELWQATRKTPPDTITLTACQTWLCICRRHDNVRVEEVPERQARLIAGILHGLNLHELTTEVPEINQYLTALLAKGWINRFEPPAAGDETR